MPLKMDIDCGHVATLADINDEIASYLVFYTAPCSGLEPPETMEFEYEHRKALLSACTRMVAMLGLDIACYPLTTTAVIFFDEDGEPIP